MSFGLQSVSKRYGLRTLAISNVSVEIRDHEFLVIYGPAGAGKSTILNILAGITKPTRGDVLQDGKSVVGVPPEKRNAAMAFENYALYSHLSVFENLAFPLRARGADEQEIKVRVKKIADVLGIGHVLEKRPALLSGGQKQRVSLGRAIIRPADIYLLDEPIGHLDAKLRHRMRAELKALAQDMKSTVAFTTTSSKEALGLADRILVLNQGRLQQVGTPQEVYSKPANAFVATFVGDPPMSLIKVGVLQKGSRLFLAASNGQFLGDVPEATGRKIKDAAKLRVGVRANALSLVEKHAVGAIQGTVASVEHLGYANIAVVDVGGDMISITTKVESRLKHGEQVGLLVKPEGIHVFDGELAIHHARSSN